jgi:hypothetical protein
MKKFDLVILFLMISFSANVFAMMAKKPALVYERREPASTCSKILSYLTLDERDPFRRLINLESVPKRLEAAIKARKRLQLPGHEAALRTLEFDLQGLEQVAWKAIVYDLAPELAAQVNFNGPIFDKRRQEQLIDLAAIREDLKDDRKLREFEYQSVVAIMKAHESMAYNIHTEDLTDEENHLIVDVLNEEILRARHLSYYVQATTEGIRRKLLVHSKDFVVDLPFKFQR